MQDEFAIVLGQDQVDAGTLEVRVEQELRIGNDDRVRRRMRMAGVKMDIGMGGAPMASRRNPAVEFASVIQRATTSGWLISI